MRLLKNVNMDSFPNDDTKIQTGCVLPSRMHETLQKVADVRSFYGNKTSLSGIIRYALQEFMDNHDDEIKELLEKITY